MVGGLPAEHHWWLESPGLQLLCARWHCHDGAVDHGHCHDGAVDHGHPFGDAVYTMPGRFLANRG